MSASVVQSSSSCQALSLVCSQTTHEPYVLLAFETQCPTQLPVSREWSHRQKDLPDDVWSLPWGSHDGTFIWQCQALGPQLGLLPTWLLLCGLGYSDCRSGHGSDTTCLRQWEACLKPLPAPHFSLSESPGEAFQSQHQSSLKF